MRLSPFAEQALPYILVAFAAAAVIAFVLRRSFATLRFGSTRSTVRTTGGSTPSRSRAAAEWPSPRRSSSSPRPSVWSNAELHVLPVPRAVEPASVVALLLGGALAAALGVLDDYFDLRARWQFAFQLGLAFLAISLGSMVELLNNPFGPGVIRLEEPFAVGSRSSGSPG